MKKKLLGLGLAGLAVLGLASCDQDKDVFNIACWNEEFQGFFYKYISDEKTEDLTATVHLDGKEVVWTKAVSDGGLYQKLLDENLKNNGNAKMRDKIDMFLAEADYILKYVNSDYTQDVKALGVNNVSNCYNYTVQAATDSNNVMKGVSFQCCPAGMIYRTDIAKEVLGVETPEAMQTLVSTWEGYDAVAAQMKEAGYYMTGSFADSYRVFSNNAESAWVTNNKLTIPAVIEDWMDQVDEYYENGYITAEGVWDEGKTVLFSEAGNANGEHSFCAFGPAWYYNFSMGTAMGEGENHTGGTYGKWAVIKGPQAYFWGGTWALAATGSDDTELVAKVMNAIIGADFSKKIVENDGQFSNNKTVNEDYAAGGKGNGFLGGQNDTQIWVDMADDIKFENVTIYDQFCNEGLQNSYQKLLKGDLTTREEVLNDFYSKITTEFPSLTINR